MRTFVVSDIHGMYDLLMERLDEVGFNKETDQLISVGDLVDRGPDSIKCVDLIDEPWFVGLMGNHEHMCLGAIHWLGQVNYAHIVHGGEWLYDLPQKRMVEVVSKLLTQKRYLELDVEGKRVLLCHADVPHNVSDVNEVDDGVLYWSSDSAFSVDNARVENYDFVIHGHTIIHTMTNVNYTYDAQGNSWVVKANRIFIDGGAYKSKKLNVIEITELLKRSTQQ